MELTNQTKLLLTIAVVALLVYFLYKNNNEAVQNDGNLDYNAPSTVDVVMDDGEVMLPEEEEEESQANTNGEESLPEEAEEQTQDSDNMSDYLKAKFDTRNRAKNGYKKINYANGKRNGNGSWNNFFDDNNNLMGASLGDNGGFAPMSDVDNEFATFKSNGDACGAGKACDPEDLFNSEKMLPQEVNDDWFDVQPEPVAVKNRHLINVTKPIGVNTIGTSKRNASHDIRGTIPNPKMTVSPWLQSSIEPDNMLRGGLC